MRYRRNVWLYIYDVEIYISLPHAQVYIWRDTTSRALKRKQNSWPQAHNIICSNTPLYLQNIVKYIIT